MSEPDAFAPCDCCEGLPPLPPRANRPGLPDLTYRLGTYGSFLEQLLAEISRLKLPPDGANLRSLKTRAPDDAAIALLDAWAIVADVLTFYQERIANEGFLRTATERRSVLELARAIGYELNPGVTANVYLAFTVEDTPKSPRRATIPKGTQIQSIPSQDQLPQTFETAIAIEAKAEWNVLKPRLTQPQKLAIEDDTLFWAGLDGNKTETNRLIFQGINTRLKPGELLLVCIEQQVMVLPVQTVTPEPEHQQTVVDLRSDVPPAPPPQFFVAIPSVFNTVSATAIPFTATAIQSEVIDQAWQESTFNAFLCINQWDVSNLLLYMGTFQLQTPEPIEPSEGVFVFRSRMGFFGNNAPAWASLPVNQRFGEKLWVNETEYKWRAGAYQEDWDSDGWEIWRTYPGKDYYSGLGSQPDVYLERSVAEITPNGWAVFEESSANPRYTPYSIREVSEKSVTGFSLSAKATGLSLADPNGNDLADTDKAVRFKVRTTTVHVQSDRLPLKDLPIETPLESTSVSSSGVEIKIGATEIMLDRLVLGLQIGQAIALQGELIIEDDENGQARPSGVIQHEIAVIQDSVHVGGFTQLVFTDSLQGRYVRKTVTLNANVVLATHGETIAEVLGSGNAAQMNQTFKLKKPPLTYIPANTASGSDSTLDVRVNGILWEESRAFYGLVPTAETYAVRIEDDGTTKVIFGDGKQGARLPTGTENITAVYRSGTGSVGEVAADSLSLLKKRPLGIQSVTNPLKASGAENPETLTNARSNAPLTVLTLDRIVSRQDYEDFARAFAGIGKAQAVALWDGRLERVHITVATASGDPLQPTDKTYTDLKAAIETLRDRSQPFMLDSFDRRYFNLSARVRLDPRYLEDTVLAQIRALLLVAFSFEQRGFGQGVSAAELVTLLQSVEGVVSVDLDNFYSVVNLTAPGTATLSSFLGSAIARWNMATQQPTRAQLLLINPAGIELEVMRDE
jgi:hypothetical protein